MLSNNGMKRLKKWRMEQVFDTLTICSAFSINQILYLLQTPTELLCKFYIYIYIYLIFLTMCDFLMTSEGLSKSIEYLKINNKQNLTKGSNDGRQ